MVPNVPKASRRHSCDCYVVAANIHYDLGDLCAIEQRIASFKQTLFGIGQGQSYDPSNRFVRLG